MDRKGFLLVTMEPPPALEEEFNAWYDTEHVPQRMAIAGFETGRRYVCPSGSPRYLAVYDLAHRGVLESEAYLRVSLDRSTPWTRRIGNRVRNSASSSKSQSSPSGGGGGRSFSARSRRS